LSQSKVCSQDTNKKVSEIGFDKVQFRKIINQQFGSLITGVSKTTIGNFVSLDLKETEVSAAGNSIFKNGSVLSYTIAGGVSDGFFPLFSNSKLNSKISVDLQYNSLSFLSKQSVTFTDKSFREFETKKNQLEYDYIEKQRALNNGKEGKRLLIEKNKLNDQVSKLQEQLSSHEDARNEAVELTELQRDSISYEIGTAKHRIGFIDSVLASPVSINALQVDLRLWRAEELKKMKSAIEIVGFKFGWVSVGYKVKKTDFKTFDSLAVFNTQIRDTNNVSHEVRVQYSFYKYITRINESYFWCVGASLNLSDNFTELTKTEFQEARDYGPNSGDRTTLNKYDAYIGAYKKKLKGVRFYADGYMFFAKDNALAVHAYPELLIKDHQKPLSNLGLGLLFSLKDSKDETAVVNTELYYNFLDLFNTADSEKKVFERNSIGLRFTFPIKFKTK